VKDQAHIENVATISANGDRSIGKVVADAVAKVGRDGVVNIEEGRAITTEVEATDGMQFDRGWVSPIFMMNSETQSSVLENAFIFVTDIPLSSVRPMVPVLEWLVEQRRPLLIIAPDFSGDVLPTFYANMQAGKLVTQLVKAPGFGANQEAMLRDIAVLTGATLLSKDMGASLESLTVEMLGEARHVTINAKNTTIVDGKGTAEAIDERINQIKAEIGRSGSEYDKDKLRERMGKLLGGVCVIKVGASSELAMKELKARMEDALFATKASIDEGIVPGGGVGYLRAAQRVQEIVDAKLAGKAEDLVLDLPINDDEWAGFRLVLSACEEPLYQIVRNAGKSGSVYVEKVKGSEDYVGVDATDFQLKNMIDAGIIDPTKVVRSALTNAVSIVGTLLTSEAIVRKPTPPKAADAHSH
jgi:chaperonin GroEL